MECCLKHLKIGFLVAGLMLLLGCESKDTKKSAQPVTQAMAPNIQQTAATPVSAPAAPQEQTPAPAQTAQP
jgi:PBP1b-binding outer membrane lipoprotein LpoB